MKRPDITVNRSDAQTIESHLRECDERFSPCLSSRVDIGEYALKLVCFADRFEAWQEERLVGLVAAYLNNINSQEGFISSVSVTNDFEGAGLAAQLMRKCIEVAPDKGCKALELEVGERDQRTHLFYLRHGFTLCGEGRTGFLRMNLKLLQP